MSGSIAVPWNTTVDDIFYAMDEGQRQHMVNKLEKHGYRSPKVKAHDAGYEELEDVLKRNVDTAIWALGVISRRWPHSYTVAVREQLHELLGVESLPPVEPVDL